MTREPGHEPDQPVDVGTAIPAAADVVFGERADVAARYREILATDGITQGLIGPREIPRLWDRHILNCAVVGELMGEAESVIDIGSGAGLPGIPLAIARPDLSVTLVEPLLRRATFLERTVTELGLAITVIRGRAESREVRDSVGPADVVTSRAVAPLARLAGWSAPLIRDRGRMLALKGSSAADEIDRDSAAVGRTGLVNLRVETCGAEVLGTETTVLVGDKIEASQRSARRQSRTRTPGAKSDRRSSKKG